jgi:hypothetical protein
MIPFQSRQTQLRTGSSHYLTLVHVTGTLIVVRPWRKACNNTQKGCGIYLVMRWLRASRFTSTRTFNFHVGLQKGQLPRLIINIHVHEKRGQRLRFTSATPKYAPGTRKNYILENEANFKNRKLADLLKGPYKLQAAISK